MTPVRDDIRRPSVLLVPPNSGLKPEPGISDEIYELFCISPGTKDGHLKEHQVTLLYTMRRA